MKAKILKKLFHLTLMIICVFLVAFNYSKHEQVEMSFLDAIKSEKIKVNYASTGNFKSIESILYNTTNSYLHLKIAKGTILKLAGNRSVFFMVLADEIIDICPHSNVDQMVYGKCFQKEKLKIN
jgi:hypothetical protein